MATINALCPVGSYSSQSRQTAVQKKNARGAQTSIMFKHNFFMNDVSIRSSSSDSHVDLIMCHMHRVRVDVQRERPVDATRSAAFRSRWRPNDHASG